MRVKKINEESNKRAIEDQEMFFNRMIETDDTLMTIYPKIKGVPEQRMKQHMKTELTKIINSNKF